MQKLGLLPQPGNIMPRTSKCLATTILETTAHLPCKRSLILSYALGLRLVGTLNSRAAVELPSIATNFGKLCIVFVKYGAPFAVWTLSHVQPREINKSSLRSIRQMIQESIILGCLGTFCPRHCQRLDNLVSCRKADLPRACKPLAKEETLNHREYAYMI